MHVELLHVNHVKH